MTWIPSRKRSQLCNLVLAFIQMVGTLMLLIVLNWQLTLITVLFDVLIVIYARYASKRSTKHYSVQQRAFGVLNAVLQKNISGA